MRHPAARSSALALLASTLLPACGGESPTPPSNGQTAAGQAGVVQAAAEETAPGTATPVAAKAQNGASSDRPEDLEETRAVADGGVHELLTEERTLADDGYWLEERITNYLTSTPLLDLRTLLRGEWSQASSMPELGDVFTDDARIAAPWPEAFDEEPLTLGVVRRKWKKLEGDEHEPLLDPENWAAALARLHDGTARVRWALVKPAQSELTDYGIHVKMKWRLNRELPGGALQHDSGYWSSEWVNTAEEGSDEPRWRCRLLEPKEGCTSLVAESPHFVDSTLEAFQGTALDPRLPTRRRGAKHRGLALADLDDDGDLDLVVTITNRVFYNRGDGTFEDRSAEVLLGGHGPDEGRGLGGVLVADFDRDGTQDIAMASSGKRPTLYRQRDGKFHPEEIAAAHPGNLPGSLAAHDVDGDGWLDLFICGYGPFFDPGPDDFTNAVNGRANQMLRGLPDGTFEDVTAAWGFDAHATRWTFAGAFGDPDADGDFDLYAANDFGPNVLYRQVAAQNGAPRFEAEIESPDEIDSGFSMSATWADIDGDLDLDMYVSNMSSTAANRVRKLPGNPHERELEADLGIDLNDVRRRMSKGNTLVLNEGDQFVEAGSERGAKGGSWAWGTALFDYDRDGDLDIHCVNGFWTQGRDDGRDL